MPEIDFKEIYNKDTFLIPISIPGTQAATTTNYGLIFTALFRCELLEVSEVHQTAGSDAGAVTLDIEKLTGTQALDAGTILLASTVNLKGATNTVVYPTLTATKLDRVINRGDRLALKDSGTLTSVAGVQVTLRLKPVGKGHYN